jgi:hypothetical protein
MNGIAQGLGAALSGYVQGRTARADLDDRRRQIALQEKDQAERMGLAMRGQESQERQALANTELERAKMEEEYLSPEESDRMWKVMLPPADFAILFPDGKTVRMKKSVVNSWILSVGLKNSENKASTVDFGAGTGGGGGTVPTGPGAVTGGPTTGVAPTAPALGSAPGPAVTPGALTTATAGAQPPPGAPAAPQAPAKMNNAAAMAWYQQEVLPYFTPTDDANEAVKGSDGSPVLNLLAGTAGQKKYLAANHTAFGKAKMGRADIQAKIAEVAGKIAQQRGTPAATAAGATATGLQAARPSGPRVITGAEVMSRQGISAVSGAQVPAFNAIYGAAGDIFLEENGQTVKISSEAYMKMREQYVYEVREVDMETGKWVTRQLQKPITVEDAVAWSRASAPYERRTINVEGTIRSLKLPPGAATQLRLMAGAKSTVSLTTKDLRDIASGASAEIIGINKARDDNAAKYALEKFKAAGKGGTTAEGLMTGNARIAGYFGMARAMEADLAELGAAFDPKTKRFTGYMGLKQTEVITRMRTAQQNRHAALQAAANMLGVSIEDVQKYREAAVPSDVETIKAEVQSGFSRVEGVQMRNGKPVSVTFKKGSKPTEDELPNELLTYVLVTRQQREPKRSAGLPHEDVGKWWEDAKLAYAIVRDYDRDLSKPMTSSDLGRRAQLVIEQANRVLYDDVDLDRIPRDVRSAVDKFVRLKRNGTFRPGGNQATGGTTSGTSGGSFSIPGMAFGGDE